MRIIIFEFKLISLMSLHFEFNIMEKRISEVLLLLDNVEFLDQANLSVHCMASTGNQPRYE